jgi:hypothetical protein
VRAKNLTEAAQMAGCSREYLSRTLSRRPDVIGYMQQRAARVLGVASTVAAARMAALIHAESEHVSFKASEHVLGVAGIAPAHQPQVSINIEVKAGYVIDLRECRTINTSARSPSAIYRRRRSLDRREHYDGKHFPMAEQAGIGPALVVAGA